MDDRDAVKVLKTNADLVSTQTFCGMDGEGLRRQGSGGCMGHPERILGADLDPGPAEDDPVYVRNLG
jgi:hypothetical protein